MKLNFKLWAMTAVALFAMNSCTQDEEISNMGGEKGTPVQFTMGVNALTRTVTDETSNVTTFENGDEVGIFAYNNETPIYLNTPYAYDEDAQSWGASAEDIEIPEDQTYVYYAYYPYQESVSTVSFDFTVESDQSAGYNKSDFLYAQNTTVGQGATTVNLAYDHAFSMVQVTLQSQDIDLTNASVTLENVLPTATINLNDHSVNGATGEATSIKMCPLTTTNVFRAIIPAQTINAGTKLLSISVDGKNYQFDHDASIEFKSGQIRRLIVTVGTAPVSSSPIDIEENVNGWGTEDEEISGSSEEEIIPIVQPFGDALVEVTGDPSSMTEDGWFGLVQNSTVQTDAAIGYDLSKNESETNWGVAGYLTYTSKWNTETSKPENNSWFKGALGYLHNSPIDVSTTFIYKVTLKIKGLTNELGTASKLVFTCRNANNDASFAMNTVTTTFTATTVNRTPNTAETWEEYIFYINFKQQSTTVGTVPTTETGIGEKNEGKGWENSDETDYSKFDLRIYTNDPAKEATQSVKAQIYVSDVVIEPYIE